MKRITLFAGHYGSGKTNIALNYAQYLRALGEQVAIADLDIVNPYFRTRDSEVALKAAGIELVVSRFANSNVDFPAMPSAAYALVADRSRKVVIDVGGDDRGALALGRYVPEIVAQDNYEMLAVVNATRPLTQTVRDTLAVLQEIEFASKLKFTGLVNNTNLGMETTAKLVIDSTKYAEEIACALGVKISFTAIKKDLMQELTGKVKNLFPLDIQRLYYHLHG